MRIILQSRGPSAKFLLSAAVEFRSRSLECDSTKNTLGQQAEHAWTSYRTTSNEAHINRLKQPVYNYPESNVSC